MSRMWRRQDDGTLVDLYLDMQDVVVVYGVGDKDLPLVCPLRDKQPPKGADYVIYDKTGWWFAHDLGVHKPFHENDLMKMSEPLPSEKW